MAQAVAGTALVAGGAAVLNQVYERDTDALMRRTRLRPLPDGRVAPADARDLRPRAVGRRPRRCWRRARTGWRRRSRSRRSSSISSIYTPMKRRTPLATLVGAVPGALPPLIGWAASHGSIDRRRRGAVRDRVPLADPALHGDRVAVPRRLRARRDSRCCRSIEPDGRRAGQAGGATAASRWCRSASRRRSSASPGSVYLASRWCSASRCSARRRASPSTRSEADRARAVLRIDHLPAAALDRR